MRSSRSARPGRGAVRAGARVLIAPTPAAHGSPLLAATLARHPEDFRVDERLAFEPGGGGEHLWLHLEKRLLNTADVIAALERCYGAGSADVGVSGLKDRRAVTRQWFSVRTPDDASVLERALEAGPGALTGGSGAGRADATPDGADDAGEPALTVLGAARHGRKLRRGTHVANAFEIVLRDVRSVSGDDDRTATAGPAGPAGMAGPATEAAEHGMAHGRGGPDARDTAIEHRLATIRALGFPNYLGPQRFGHGGRNVERARAWFRAPRRRATRLQRGLWLSAARSELFNRVCAARVTDGSWATLLDGEPASLDGSRSFFVPGADDEATLASRLHDGDVHPSGPWWGRGESPARGACAALERAALADHADLREGLERAGLDQERRALRARAPDLHGERLDDDTLRLSFTLAPGTFATTLLAELGACTRAGAG